MKQLKIFSVGAVALLMLFSSCNSDEKTTDTTTTGTDTTTQQKPPDTKQVSAYVLLVKHKVANFDKWMPAYEGHDSARLAYGLHNFTVSRGIKDSNMVMVALRIDDTAKAKEFAMLPDLKTAMQKGGVMGTPTFLYMESVWRDTTQTAPTRVMINAKVKDFDAWKKSFDSHKDKRMEAGLGDRVVSHAVGDPHFVSVVLTISDMPKAEAFFNSQELKDRMKEGGVEGKPDVFFYRAVKQY